MESYDYLDSSSSAMISAEIPSTSKNSGRNTSFPRSRPGFKRKFPFKQSPGDKRRKFTPKADASKSIPSSSFQKRSATEVRPTSGIQMYATRRVFPIYVGNSGVGMLSKLVFKSIQARDYRTAVNINELQLKYVLTMAYANRVVQTGIYGGYAIDIPAASDLKRAAAQIQLPGILVKYIQTIGILTKATGSQVGPYSGGPRELFPPGSDGQVTPESILREAGRELPNNPWCIDYEWILSWNQATTRPSRLGMHFSTVDMANFEGSPEMLVSSQRRVDELDDASDTGLPILIRGVAPQVMSEAEGQMGAVFNFRNYSHQQSWLPGNKQMLYAEFNTTEFIAEQFLSDLIVKDFTE